MAATSDAELIQMAREGDREALEALLLARAGWLSNYIGQQLPDHLRCAVDEDDVLQQTFFRAFRAITQLATSNEQAFNAWLATIAQNQLRDVIKALRRRKRAPERLLVRNAANASSLTPLVEFLSDHQDTPFRHTSREEAIQAIQIGLAGLPEEQHQALRLSAIEGRSTEDVAAILQKTPAAVRGLIHRGKKNLRASLGRSSRWLDKKS